MVLNFKNWRVQKNKQCFCLKSDFHWQVADNWLFFLKRKQYVSFSMKYGSVRKNAMLVKLFCEFLIPWTVVHSTVVVINPNQNVLWWHGTLWIDGLVCWWARQWTFLLFSGAPVGKHILPLKQRKACPTGPTSSHYPCAVSEGALCSIQRSVLEALQGGLGIQMCLWVLESKLSFTGVLKLSVLICFLFSFCIILLKISGLCFLSC